MDLRVNVLFTLNIQLGVIHIEEMTDGSFTLELVSMSNPCDYLADKVQTYAEQQ